jgi:hypothetical protein
LLILLVSLVLHTFRIEGKDYHDLLILVQSKA